MSSIGTLFRLTTAGESHGVGLIGIVDGCPPNLALSEADIQKDLDRRRPGQSRYTTPRREADNIIIQSGVFEGRTTGAPIALFIANEDTRSQDYAAIKDRFRPGHADYTYLKKYGHYDYRGSGRASARETAMRVAGGAIAKHYLAALGITIRAAVIGIGDIRVAEEEINWQAVNNNPLFCPHDAKARDMQALLDTIKKEGDSVGALIRIEATHMMAGLGHPVFDRLDADWAKALMSINAVKGVEVGAGFAVARQRGSAHRDQMDAAGFISNNSGGILGGISNGHTLVATIALKPTSSIRVPGQTQRHDGTVCEVVTKGRHDPCVGIRAVPIAEAMTALVLADHHLRHKAQCL